MSPSQQQVGLEENPSEAALRDNEARYHALFDATGALYLVLAADAPRFTITDVNQAYLRATMTEREVLLGRGIFEAFPDNPDDPQASGVRNLKASLERAVASRCPDAMAVQKYDIRRPDGSFEERHWSPVNTPILDASGEPIGIIHHVEDVTEFVRLRARGAESDRLEAEIVAANQRLQQANDRLRESEANFHMLADNMAPLAWICDSTLGNVTWYNQRWLDYTGLAFEDMRGWDWSKVQHPDHRERVVASIKRSAETGDPWEDTFPLRGRDGQYRWFLSRAAPIRDEGGAIVRWFGTNTDVTATVEAEAALREQQERARRVEKLAAAGQLAASLAHEINNPLSSVVNALYLLETYPGLDEPAREYATIAASELARVSHIVKQSLSYYRVDAVPVNLNPTQVAEGSIQIYRERLQRVGIEVKQNIRNVSPILGFPNELRQVIDNLLLNSLQAMPRGGRLTIAVRDSLEWTKGHRRRKGVRITVADTGCGISSENQRRIFEPFFTTKLEKGTGLGLWVLQGIVVKHEGAVRLRSSDRKGRSGTVVSIFLPSSSRALSQLRRSTDTV